MILTSVLTQSCIIKMLCTGFCNPGYAVFVSLCHQLYSLQMHIMMTSLMNSNVALIMCKLVLVGKFQKQLLVRVCKTFQFCKRKEKMQHMLVVRKISFSELLKQVLHLKEKRWVLVLNNYLARLNYYYLEFVWKQVVNQIG